jgi:hypothetical protein
MTEIQLMVRGGGAVRPGVFCRLSRPEQLGN